MDCKVTRKASGVRGDRQGKWSNRREMRVAKRQCQRGFSVPWGSCLTCRS